MGRELSLRGMVYASLFGALTAVGAYMIIPIPPVPVTMQNFFTCLAAALLGGRLGALSQVVYVALGVLGLPVFAGGRGGLGVLLGPTGGYLAGFIAGAYVMGKLIEWRREPHLAWIMASFCMGFAVLYTLGVLQLALVAKLTFSKALAVGVLPFIPGDILKIILAAWLTTKIRARIKLKENFS